MNNIYAYGTEFGGIWLRCNLCGTSSQEKRLNMGIPFDVLAEWVANHKCVAPKT